MIKSIHPPVSLSLSFSVSFSLSLCVPPSLCCVSRPSSKGEESGREGEYTRECVRDSQSVSSTLSSPPPSSTSFSFLLHEATRLSLPGGFRASHCFEKTDRFYDPFQPLFRRDSRKLAARCLSLFAALRGSLRLLEARVRFSSRFTNIFSRLLEQRSRQLNINRKSRIFLVFWLFSIVMKLDL